MYQQTTRRALFLAFVTILTVVCLLVYLRQDETAVPSHATLVETPLETRGEARSEAATSNRAATLLRTMEAAHSIEVRRPVSFLPSAAEERLNLEVREILHGVEGERFSETELQQLSEAYVLLQTVRGAFEAEIGSMYRKGNGYTLEIPPYPGAGESLRNEFRQSFRDCLGSERGDRAYAAVAATLDHVFRGFGVDRQVVELTPAGATTSGEAMYRITRTQQAVSTRSNPGSDALFHGATGTSIVTASDLQSGELANFARLFTTEVKLQPKTGGG